MARWSTHREWAERLLEWGESAPTADRLGDLVDFPRRRGFILPEHDFNRRTWRSGGNRNAIYNAFGERGLLVMDLHYCLDFLKEETDPDIIRQRWRGTFPGIEDEEILEVYPSVTDLARYLAGKVKNLDIDREVFKFVIVNFREILRDLVSEHDYSPRRFRDWENSSFNRMLEEITLIR